AWAAGAGCDGDCCVCGDDGCCAGTFAGGGGGVGGTMPGAGPPGPACLCAKAVWHRPLRGNASASATRANVVPALLLVALLVPIFSFIRSRFFHNRASRIGGM